VPCDRAAAAHIQGFLEHLDTGLSDEMRDSVAYAFRELLLNAIEWGGRLDPTRKVRIACLRTRRMLLYRIADPGPGFKLEGLAHAAVGQPADSPIAHVDERERMGLRPGGFGILTVRAMVDELIYNEAQNEVVFVKYLD
jgi:anti-sigma regulatory factor (Ser/Thr protein kinase)